MFFFSFLIYTCGKKLSITQSLTICFYLNLIKKAATKVKPKYQCVNQCLNGYFNPVPNKQILGFSNSVSTVTLALWLEHWPLEREVVGSIPGHVRSKSLKLVVVAFPLAAQDYAMSGPPVSG